MKQKINNISKVISYFLIASIIFLYVLLIIPRVLTDKIFPPTIVTIHALGEKTTESKGSEVWFSGLSINGNSHNIDNYVLESHDWEKRDTLFVFYQKESASMKLKFSSIDSINLTFNKGEYSGLVEVTTNNGYKKIIDTYGNGFFTCKIISNRWFLYFLYAVILFMLTLIIMKLEHYFQNKKSESMLYKKAIDILHFPLLWIILFAIVFRIYYFSGLLEYTIFNDTPGYTYFPDLLHGQVLMNRTPGYPILIQMIRLIVGEANLYHGIVFIQSLLGIACTILTYSAMKKILTQKSLIILASVYIAILPQLIGFEKCIITENFSIFGSVLLFYVLVCYIKKPGTVSAFLIGFIAFANVMIRPANLPFPIILLVFWLLRIFIYKKERKTCIVGFASLCICFFLLLSYSLLNYRSNGYFGISSVALTHNVSAMEIESNLYSGNYTKLDQVSRQIKERIDELKLYPENRFNRGKESNGLSIEETNAKIDSLKLSESLTSYDIKSICEIEFGTIEMEYFAKNVLSNNLPEYFNYILKVNKSILNDKIISMYPNKAANINSIQFFDNLGFLMFPFTFLQLHVLILGLLIFYLVRWIIYKQIDWIPLGTVVFILCNTTTVLTLQYAEFQRSIVNMIPYIIFSVFIITNFLIEHYITSKKYLKVSNTIDMDKE